MPKIGDCTTRGAHCVACGRPHDLMVGSISPCCERRVTTASTCEGLHPVYELTPTPGVPTTDADVDAILVPLLRDVAATLVAGGRQPDQALDDIGRANGHLQDMLAWEMQATVDATGQLPG